MRIRLGMITPSLNTVLEPVTYRLVHDLPDVSAHFSRVRVTQISLDDNCASQFAAEPMIEAIRRAKKQSKKLPKFRLDFCLISEPFF